MAFNSRAYNKLYYKTNAKRLIAAAKVLADRHRIRILVRGHLVATRDEKNNSYRNMPFYEKWNPQKGGSYVAAEKWILENIGPRPKDGKYHLHVVDRRVGFMPGNLSWIPVGAHKREELLNKVLLENQQLRERLKKYEKDLDKTSVS